MYERKRQKTILYNYLAYVVCFVILCLIGLSNVLALTYTNIGEIRNVTQQLVSTAYGNAPFTNPVNSGYAFGQVLQVDYLIDNYQFNANTNYQLESNLPDQVFTNANYYSVQGLNGESCLISYNNSILNNDHYPRWAFQCPHATDYITISIKNSSNEYLWSGTGIFNWTTALLKYSDTSLSSGSSDTDAIINNQNQNTQNIINNQNQNTQNIINNQNQNTQQQIESQLVCSYTTIDKSSIIINDSYLDVDGNITSNQWSSGWGITDYLQVDYVKKLNQYGTSVSTCFYKEDKSLISCSTHYSTSVGEITLPSNTFYVRFSINSSENKPQYYVNLCKNGNQAITDTLTDDTIDTSDATSFFEDFTDNTHGLSGVISAPLVAVNSMLDGQCSPLSATWKGQTMSIDCGYSFWSRLTGFKEFLNVALDGLLCYRILVKLFKLIENIKNPNDDRVEVMDL